MQGQKLVTLVAVALAGCAAPPPPPPPPAPPPAPAPPPPPPVAWTARTDAPVRGDSASGVISGLLTRVEVLAADSGEFRIRCGVCADRVAGRVTATELIFAPPPLAEAARGTVAQFALALRDAIAKHDVPALRSVMAPDFSSGFVGPSNPDVAFVAWRTESYRSLDEAVTLLDRGLVPLGEGLWAAPAEFRTRPGYRGLRIGIGRGAGGRWEWKFLVRGEGG